MSLLQIEIVYNITSKYHAKTLIQFMADLWWIHGNFIKTHPQFKTLEQDTVALCTIQIRQLKRDNQFHYAG